MTVARPACFYTFTEYVCGSHSRPTQPSIPPESVNEYQLRLERQRQVWFIPLADEHGVCR